MSGHSDRMGGVAPQVFVLVLSSAECGELEGAPEFRRTGPRFSVAQLMAEGDSALREVGCGRGKPGPASAGG